MHVNYWRNRVSWIMIQVHLGERIDERIAPIRQRYEQLMSKTQIVSGDFQGDAVSSPENRITPSLLSGRRSSRTKWYFGERKGGENLGKSEKSHWLCLEFIHWNRKKNFFQCVDVFCHTSCYSWLSCLMYSFVLCYSFAISRCSVFSCTFSCHTNARHAFVL